MERGDVQRPHPIGPFLEMEDPMPGARKTNMLVVLLGATGSHTAGPHVGMLPRRDRGTPTEAGSGPRVARPKVCDGICARKCEVARAA